MAASASSSTAAAVKPTATIATKIGLTVPIKEKAIKAYVASLAGGLPSLPRQVPKATIVTVSAAVEKLLDLLLRASVPAAGGTTFNVDNLLSAIRGAEGLQILVPFLGRGLEHVQAAKLLKKSKRKEGEEPAEADEDAGGKSPFSFSCLNHIGKQIKSHNDALRVSSDATDLVQSLLDQFYQHVVGGAFRMAERNSRKTISKDDIVVALQIFIPEHLAGPMLEHVDEVAARFKLVEKAKADEAKAKAAAAATAAAPAAGAPAADAAADTKGKAAAKVVKKTVVKPVK